MEHTAKTTTNKIVNIDVYCTNGVNAHIVHVLTNTHCFFPVITITITVFIYSEFYCGTMSFLSGMVSITKDQSHSKPASVHLMQVHIYIYISYVLLL